MLWIFGAAIVAVLLPIAPPDDRVSQAGGWALGAGVIAICVVSAIPLLRRPRGVTPAALLAMGYASLGLVALLHWAGGVGSPFDELFIISVIYVSSVHPPRRVALFMVAVVACMAAPLLYAEWDSSYAAEALAHVLLWFSLSVAATLFTAAVRVNRMDLLQGEQVAHALARRDPLTGLGNRRAFDEALGQVVAGGRSSDRPLTLIIADIEGFKRVNDAHGHLEGDRCLRGVARAVTGSIRPSDTAFRWGGDEFAVLLPATVREQARVVVDRIAGAVERDVPLPGGRSVRLRYGVAEIEDSMDAEALLAAADSDLQAARPAIAEPTPKA